MDYSEWEEWFLRANKKTYEAEMKVVEFEDKGDTNSDAYYSWKKEAREWRENQDYAISEHSSYHSKYLENRGKSTQSKASSEANGGDYSSLGDYFWSILVYLYLVPSMIMTSFWHSFNYTFKDFFYTVFIPFKYIKLDEYWSAAGIFFGNIIASIILLMVVMISIDSVGKNIFVYVLITALFFIIPLSRPW